MTESKIAAGVALRKVRLAKGPVRRNVPSADSTSHFVGGNTANVEDQNSNITHSSSLVSVSFEAEDDKQPLNPLGNRTLELSTEEKSKDAVSVVLEHQYVKPQLTQLGNLGYDHYRTIELSTKDVSVGFWSRSVELNKTGKRIFNKYLSHEKMSGEISCLTAELYLQDLLLNYRAPSVQFIKLETLAHHGSFPRCPDHKELLTDIRFTDRSSSLFVFVSHSWMRGYPGTKGWTGSPHPDNNNGDKFALCIDGIRKIKKYFAPDMDSCYVWFDYCCMDQDSKDLSSELENYDVIVEYCDCIFSPIVDEEYCEVPENIFQNFSAKRWKGGPDAYLSRAWCRVEMMYAANIPVLADNRHGKFKEGLAYHNRNNRRPHFLYPSRLALEDSAPSFLQPLQHSFFSEYHPMKGSITNESDWEKIVYLVAELQPYIDEKLSRVGYKGDTNECGQKHGEGVMVYENGDVYEGEWKNDLHHGFGIFTYANGAVYFGHWENGVHHGQGRFTSAEGTGVEGYFENGKASSTKTMELFTATDALKPAQTELSNAMDEVILRHPRVKDSVSVTSDAEPVINFEIIDITELRRLYEQTKVLYDQQTSRLQAEEIRWEIEASKVDNLTTELNELKGRHSHLLAEYQSLCQTKDDLTNQLNEAVQVNSTLSSDFNRLSSEQTSQVSLLIAAHKEISIKKNEFDSLNESYSRLLSDFQSAQKELDGCKRTVEKRNDEINDLTNELTRQRDLNLNLENTLQTTIAKNAEDFNAMSTKLNDVIKLEKSRWQAEASRVDGINEALSNSQNNCSQLANELNETQSILRRTENQLQLTQKKLDDANETLRMKDEDAQQLRNTLKQKCDQYDLQTKEQAALSSAFNNLLQGDATMQMNLNRSKQSVENLQQELTQTQLQLEIQRNLNKNLEESLQQVIEAGQKETQTVSTQLNQKLHVEKLRWEVEASRVDEITQHLKENQRVIDRLQSELDTLTLQHRTLAAEFNAAQVSLSNLTAENRTLQADLASSNKFAAFYESQFNSKSVAFDMQSQSLAESEEQNRQFQISLGINGNNEAQLLGQLAVAKVQLQEATARVEDLTYQLEHYDCIPCKEKEILCQQTQQRLTAEELRWEIEASKVDIVRGKMHEAEAERERMRLELEGFKREFDELELELVETQKKYHDLSEEMDAQKQRNRTLEETLSYSEKQLLEQNTDFRDLLKEYDKLETEFRATHEKYQTTRKELKEVKAQYQESEQQLQEARGSVSELDRRVEQLLERLRLEMDGGKDLKANYEKVKAKCGEVLTREEKLKIELQRCEDRLLKFEGLPSMEEVKAKLTAMQNELNNTKKHHQKMESEYDSLQATIASQSETIQNKDLLIGELTNDINNAQEFVNSRNSVILSLQEKLTQAGETESQLREQLQTTQEEVKVLKSAMKSGGDDEQDIDAPASANQEAAVSHVKEVVVSSHLQDLADNKDLMGLITELSKIDNDLVNIAFCSQALLKIVTDNPKIVDLLCDLHIDHVLFQLITQHPSNITIQFNCIQLVAVISSSVSCGVLFSKLMGELGVIYSILVAMRLYLEDESFLYYCLNALSNLCNGGIDNSNRFILYKGIPLLLHTLSHHMQSSVIQRHGCILIFTLCSVSPEVCKALYSLGGDVAAINAMISHRQDVFIQQYGFDVLGVMAMTGGADYTNRTKKKKVVEICKYALETHANNVELVKTVNKFLSVLSSTKHFTMPKGPESI